MTAVIVDDEPLAIAVIRKYCEDIPAITVLMTFTDAVQALAYLKNEKADLLILDIQMPDISGLQLLQQLERRPMVIFTTAYAQYAVKGFELEAVDYLVKPVKSERFFKAIEKAQTLMNMRFAVESQAAPDHLVVKSGYSSVQVNLCDISYIEGLDDYIKIHLADEERPVVSLMSLKAMVDKLPPEQFMRIHRSFIVSLKAIRSIRRRHVYLDKAALPVGDTYMEAVHRWLGH